MRWFTLIFILIHCVLLSYGSKNDIKHLLSDVLPNLSSYSQIEKQQFVDTFSQLILNEIKQKASKSVELNDVVSLRLRYGWEYGMKSFAQIAMNKGITSKPTFEFVNATIDVSDTPNRLDFNIRVNFDDIRLTYSECTLNISGTSQNGILSARVSKFQGVFGTLLNFKENGWKWLRRSRTPLSNKGNFLSSINSDVVLSLPEKSRNLFVIYANMVDPDDFKSIFQEQMLWVFNSVIIDHIDDLYLSLK